MSDCGEYLIVTSHEECRDNLVFFGSLKNLGEEGIKGKLPLTQVVFKLENDFEVNNFILHI